MTQKRKNIRNKIYREHKKHKIKEVRHAVRHAVKEINDREGVYTFKLFKGRKGVAGAYIVSEQDNIYCVKFQKSLFYNFSYEDDAGNRKRVPGVSFRADQLYKAKDEGYIPMVILSDGKMYYYPAKEWVKWCNTHNKKDNTVICRHKGREEKTDFWAYYNLPISMVKRYNEG